MAGPIGEPRDKADRPKSPVPPGCGKMRRLLRRAPRHRSPSYDLRRAPRIHPRFARNAIRVGLIQRFLSRACLPFEESNATAPACCSLVLGRLELARLLLEHNRDAVANRVGKPRRLGDQLL